MRVQPTAIEILNIKHPGLQLDVETMLQSNALLADVQSMLRKKFSVSVSHQTLSKHKQKRWLPSLQRIQDRVERTTAVIKVIKKEGDSDFARAFIFEQLDEAERRGERVPPEVLLREQRMRVELRLHFQELEQTKRKLQMGIEKAVLGLDAATRDASKRAGGRGFNIDEINRIREQTFGLPPIDPATRAKRDPEVLDRVFREIYGLNVPTAEPVEPKGVDLPKPQG
jgi:hypothetical protein